MSSGKQRTVGINDPTGLFRHKCFHADIKAVLTPTSPLGNVRFSSISPNLADVSRYEDMDFLPVMGTVRMEVPEGGFLIKIYESPLEVTISKGCRK